MKISLVIPTLNAGALLDEVLDAVDRQPGADALEKIAVDSGSDDGTLERLERHGFDTFGIDKREFNHGATRDLAIDRAEGDVVVLLTQDATPADDEWLPRIVASYKNPRVAAAYCRQVPRPDCNPFIARRLREWTAGKTEPVEQRLEAGTSFEALEPMQRLQLCAYDNVAGSVRRSVWQEHRFGHRRFGEDVAFGKRLILAGHSIQFEPRSAVIHSHNRSAIEEGKRIYCDHQNLRDLFDVHLLPTWKSCKDSIEWGQREYGKIVDELGLPESERIELRAWAEDYAKWSALGMYLGANSKRNGVGALSDFYSRLDNRLHRGI